MGGELPSASGDRTYILSGVNSRGRRETREVAGANPSAAVEALRLAGFRDIQVQIDDDLRTFQGPPTSLSKRNTLTPKDLVACYYMRPGRNLKMRLGIMWRANKGVFLWPVASVVLLSMLWSSRGFRWTDLILVAVTVAPLAFIAWVMLRPDPMAPSNRVYRAIADGRWEDVLRLLPAMEHSLRVLSPGQRDVEVTRLRAGALIKLGRAQEGMDQLRALEGRADVAPLVLLGVRYEVYLGLREFDSAEMCCQQMVESFPESPVAWITLAEFLALRTTRMDEAQAALDCVDAALAIPITGAFHKFLQGVIAVERQQHATAVGILSNALERIRSTCTSVSGVVPIARCIAYLAIAEGRSGNREAAEKLWDEAKDLVELHGPDRLKVLCSLQFPSTSRRGGPH